MLQDDFGPDSILPPSPPFFFFALPKPQRAPSAASAPHLHARVDPERLDRGRQFRRQTALRAQLDVAEDGFDVHAVVL
jgi:hypothetical protein